MEYRESRDRYAHDVQELQGQSRSRIETQHLPPVPERHENEKEMESAGTENKNILVFYMQVIHRARGGVPGKITPIIVCH